MKRMTIGCALAAFAITALAGAADVGIDLGTPVVEAIGAEAKSRFTGRIPKVTIEVK